MPVEIRNVLKMEGITALPLFTKETDFGVKDVMTFDFERLIPIPEALKMRSSSIEDLAIEAVLRSDASIRAEVERIREVQKYTDQQYLSSVADCGKTEEQLRELGMQYINIVRLYGTTSWCDWCIENWGTGLNSYKNMRESADTIMFTTAWTAPLEVIAKLAQMYPDAVIEHWWADEGVGYNSGYAKYSGGEAEVMLCHEDDSAEAHETYIRCWGRSQYLYRMRTSPGVSRPAMNITDVTEPGKNPV